MGKVYDLFIGTYGEENEETIHWLRFDSEAITFEKVYAVKGIKNPSYVVVNNERTHLYAVSEVENGEIVSYRIDYEEEKLHELNRQPTKGDPCFIEIDEHDRFLFTANFGSGSLIVHPIKNGEIGKHTDFHEFDSRRATSNIHGIKNIPGTNKFVVSDQGHDNIRVFNHRAGKLHMITDFLVADFTAPRQIAFNRELNMMYVINQKDSTLFVYNYDEKCEQFDLVQILTTLLEPYYGKNQPGDIHVAGSFLYVSNRGHNSLSAFEIKEDGRLDLLGNLPSGGKWPRNFGVVPNDKQLIVANEQTDNLVVMDILPNGSLKEHDVQYNIHRPVCVQMIAK